MSRQDGEGGQQGNRVDAALGRRKGQEDQTGHEPREEKTEPEVLSSASETGQERDKKGDPRGGLGGELDSIIIKGLVMSEPDVPATQKSSELVVEKKDPEEVAPGIPRDLDEPQGHRCRQNREPEPEPGAEQVLPGAGPDHPGREQHSHEYQRDQALREKPSEQESVEGEEPAGRRGQRALERPGGPRGEADEARIGFQVMTDEDEARR